MPGLCSGVLENEYTKGKTMKSIKYVFSVGLLLGAFSLSNAYGVAPQAIAPKPIRQEKKVDYRKALQLQKKLANTTGKVATTSKDGVTKCKCFKENDITLRVQQRFYQFQDATSILKQVGRSGDTTLINEAMAHFLSFMDPNYTVFQFTTVGGVYSFPTLTDISNAYYYFATQVFNGFSQHFSTNVVVGQDPTNPCQALMTAGGGEWGSLLDTSVSPPVPFEQTTISNWDLTWVWLPNGPTGPNWYITQYNEYGDRLFRFNPACGPYTLSFARQFPGSIPEPTVSSFSSCP